MKIIFSRKDLIPNRQLIFDEAGTLVTDARYSDYKDYNAVLFPSRIEIKRPVEEYDITLTMVDLAMNLPLPDSKFALNQPAGAQVIHLDSNTSNPQGGGTH